MPSFLLGKSKDKLIIRSCFFLIKKFNLQHIHYRTSRQGKEDSKIVSRARFFGPAIALFCLLTVIQADGYAQESATCKINLSHIAAIESSGRSNAVGDSGKALGLFQLHKAAVLDASRALKASYSHQDALEPTISRKLADAYLNVVIPRYLRHYGLRVTKENVIWAYNAGVGSVRKGKMPRVTRDYLAKYRALEASA